MSALQTLATQLEAAIVGGNLTLPNKGVTEVQLTGFINDVIRSNNVQVTAAKVSLSDTTLTLSGTIDLFSIALDLTWTFTDDSGDITWAFGASTTDTAGINDVLSHFLTTVPTLPASVSNLNLTKIGISTSYDSKAKHYSLALDASTSWGCADLVVTYNNGQWGSALGIALSSKVTLAQISSDLGVFDDLSFSKSAVLISDFDDDSLTLAGISGVKDGIQLRSTLTLQPNATGDSAIVKIANELATSLSSTEIDITAVLSSSSATLTASIPGPFGFPGYSKLQLSEIDFSIDTTPSASLAGTLVIPVTIPGNPGVTSITVTGTISFAYADGTGTIEATLSSDTKIVEPFKIQGFTLLDIGFGIDASFGTETGAGLSFFGGFELGGDKLTEQFALTVDIDDELPNPSLLYLNSSNLSLPAIFDAVISSSIKLPSVLSGFAFNPLVLYWCDKAQTIPVGPLEGSTCQPGVGFNAGINFWGFDTYAALMITQSSGIKGQASIDPISLWNGKVTITGKGTGGSGVKPGGAFFDFDTSKTSFDASLDASILGLTTQDSASISSDSLAISMKSNFGFLQDTVTVNFNGLTDMAFKSQLKVSISASPTIKIGGVTLGTIDIHDSLSGSLSVSVSGTTLKAEVKGKFSWNSHGFSFDYDLAADLNDLSELASAIAAKIVSEATDIFGSYFADAKNYLSAFGKGLLRNGDFVLDVLHNAYSEGVDDIIDAIASLEAGIHIDGDPSFEIDISQSVPSVGFHADFGKLVNVHADLFGVGKHADVSFSHGFNTPSFSLTLLDVKAGGHFDLKMPPQVHADVSSPHLDQSVHVDASLVGGSVGVSGKTKVDSKVRLDDVDLNARFSASEHVGVHADVAHIGKHADESAHADFGI